MKNLIFAGIITALVIVLFGCSKEKTTSHETSSTNDSVIIAAKAYLSSFKSSILIDNVNNYGFSSSAELDQIQIGTPFLKLYLTAAFRNDSIYDHFDKYVLKVKDWRVPLMIGNDIRCFLDVCVWKDSLQGIGGGSSILAKSVDDCMKKYNIQSENRYIIEDHVYGNCLFIMAKNEDNITIYPVQDYLPIGNWNPTYCKNLDKVYYRFEDLFYEFKKEDSCFPVPCPGCVD
jgi:hypothetical protein